MNPLTTTGNTLGEKLRGGQSQATARIRDDALIPDMRTVPAGEIGPLAEDLLKALVV